MKDRSRIAQSIIGILGIASAAYGAAVFAIIGSGHWFNYVFLVLGLALVVLSLLMPKLVKWIDDGDNGAADSKCCRNIRRGVVRILLFIICLCLINFGIFEAKVIKFANSKPAQDANWVIVLGAKVKPGNIPSLEYALRLGAASDYLTMRSRLIKEGNPNVGPANLILTGGQGADEPASEASIGYLYLKQLILVGESNDDVISEKQIFLEEKSVSTSENLKFAREIIEAQGGSANDSAVIVSSSFHLYRASVLAREQGFTNTSYKGSTGLKILIPYYYVREYAAYVREKLPF